VAEATRSAAWAAAKLTASPRPSLVLSVRSLRNGPIVGMFLGKKAQGRWLLVQSLQIRSWSYPTPRPAFAYTERWLLDGSAGWPRDSTPQT